MKQVRIRDISPRLAFQAFQVDTAQKVELVNRLTEAGIMAVEVSSFVNPSLVPGLADAAEVFSRVDRPTGVSLECCVANRRGLQQAMDAGAHKAWFLLSADEAFSKLNTGRTVAESLAELEAMRKLADGSGTQLGTYLIAAFGGPTGLARGPQDIAPVVEQLVALEVYQWILADSCGYAAPPQVLNMVEFAAKHTDITNLTVQVHDSRGMGLANIAELARMGFSNIDTALAGSGAHPAALAALVGGTCTEDAVQMLDLMGVKTGIDLNALVDAANWLNTLLGGTAIGYVRRTGAVPVDPNAVEPLRTWQQLGDGWNQAQG